MDFDPERCDAMRAGHGIVVAARSTATADAVGDACCAAGLAAEAVRVAGQAAARTGPRDGQSFAAAGRGDLGRDAV